MITITKTLECHSCDETVRVGTDVSVLGVDWVSLPEVDKAIAIAAEGFGWSLDSWGHVCPSCAAEIALISIVNSVPE
jgi:hypothetical protein